jgi:uncharacterized protein YxjI
MELTIKQKKLTFFVDKYEIFDADDMIFTAKSVLFSFPKKVKVFNKENIEKITLIKALTLIHPEFDIIFSGGAHLCLEGKSWIYDYFILRVPEGTFEVHHQKGLKLSIFLNNEQVAEISKNTVAFFGGDEYRILANSDINKELLIGICLAWDLNDFDDKNTVMIDLGNIGPVKKKSESNWKPVK